MWCYLEGRLSLKLSLCLAWVGWSKQEDSSLGHACRMARQLSIFFSWGHYVPTSYGLFDYDLCRSLVKKSGANMLDLLSLEWNVFLHCSSCPPAAPGCLGSKQEDSSLGHACRMARQLSIFFSWGHYVPTSYGLFDYDLCRSLVKKSGANMLM